MPKSYLQLAVNRHTQHTTHKPNTWSFTHAILHVYPIPGPSHMLYHICTPYLVLHTCYITCVPHTWSYMCAPYLVFKSMIWCYDRGWSCGWSINIFHRHRYPLIFTVYTQQVNTHLGNILCMTNCLCSVNLAGIMVYCRTHVETGKRRIGI